MRIIDMLKLLFGMDKKTTTSTTSTQIGDTKNMKRALHIGINDYAGTQNDLRGCVNDANKWKDTATRRSFTSFVTLLDSKATRSNVKKEIQKIISDSKAGDTLLITYSGHGSKVQDLDGDELDNVEETLYLYDGNLIDDEIREMLSKIAEGVKAVIISDSCHSGTVTRALFSTLSSEDYIKPRYMPPKDMIDCAAMGALESAKPFAFPEEGMNHILISGAASTEYSYDAQFDKPMGALTYYATQIIDSNPHITYNEFYTLLRQQLPSNKYPQTPQLEGPDSLKNSKIF